MATGAEFLVQLLTDRGVDVAFGVPGVHNLAFCERREKLMSDPSIEVLSALFSVSPDVSCMTAF